MRILKLVFAILLMIGSGFLSKIIFIATSLQLGLVFPVLETLAPLRTNGLEFILFGSHGMGELIYFISGVFLLLTIKVRWFEGKSNIPWLIAFGFTIFKNIFSTMFSIYYINNPKMPTIHESVILDHVSSGPSKEVLYTELSFSILWLIISIIGFVLLTKAMKKAKQRAGVVDM